MAWLSLNQGNHTTMTFSNAFPFFLTAALFFAGSGAYGADGAAQLTSTSRNLWLFTMSWVLLGAGCFILLQALRFHRRLPRPTAVPLVPAVSAPVASVVPFASAAAAPPTVTPSPWIRPAVARGVRPRTATRLLPSEPQAA